MALFQSRRQSADVSDRPAFASVPRFEPARFDTGSAPAPAYPSRIGGSPAFAKPEWQAFQEFERLVENYYAQRGCCLLPVSVIDVGGCPEYWNENYRLDENPLNLRITLFHEAADAWRDPRFHYLAGGYESLDGIPDKTFDIAFSTQPFLIKDLAQQLTIIESMKRIGSRVFIRTPG